MLHQRIGTSLFYGGRSIKICIKIPHVNIQHPKHKSNEYMCNAGNFNINLPWHRIVWKNLKMSMKRNGNYILLYPLMIRSARNGLNGGGTHLNG